MNPSLALIPSAFNTGKLYSVLPEDGTGDFTVSRNGNATYFDKDGILRTALPNQPRFDFDPLTGQFRGVLVEPASTNLVLRSEEFSLSNWQRPNTNISNLGTFINQNQTTSFLLSSANLNLNPKFITQPIQPIIGTTYTQSWFVKKTTFDFIQVSFNNNFGDQAFANFDIQNGLVTRVGTTATASIIKLKDGWYRCSVTATATGGALSNTPSLFLITNGLANNFQSHSSYIECLIFGAQIEVGSVATSYIPTVASQVLRPADVITRTNAQDLIGQTEGTIYAEINVSKLLGNVNRRIIALSNNNSATETIQLLFTSGGTNLIRGLIASGGNFPFISATPLTTTGVYKIAFSYSQTDAVMYINGVKQGVDLGSVVKPSMNTINIGNNNNSDFYNDTIKSVYIFKTRLTNAQLQALTTL